MEVQKGENRVSVGTVSYSSIAGIANSLGIGSCKLFKLYKELGDLGEAVSTCLKDKETTEKRAREAFISFDAEIEDKKVLKFYSKYKALEDDIVKVSLDGKTLIFVVDGKGYKGVSGLCNAFGISYSSLESRIKNGMLLSEALISKNFEIKSIPVQFCGSTYTNVSCLCDAYSITIGVWNVLLKTYGSVSGIEGYFKNLINIIKSSNNPEFSNFRYLIDISRIPKFENEDILYQINNYDKVKSGDMLYLGGKSYKSPYEFYSEYGLKNSHKDILEESIKEDFYLYELANMLSSSLQDLLLQKRSRTSILICLVKASKHFTLPVRRKYFKNVLTWLDSGLSFDEVCGRLLGILEFKVDIGGVDGIKLIGEECYVDGNMIGGIPDLRKYLRIKAKLSSLEDVELGLKVARWCNMCKDTHRLESISNITLRYWGKNLIFFEDFEYLVNNTPIGQQIYFYGRCFQSFNDVIKLLKVSKDVLAEKSYLQLFREKVLLSNLKKEIKTSWYVKYIEYFGFSPKGFYYSYVYGKYGNGGVCKEEDTYRAVLNMFNRGIPQRLRVFLSECGVILYKRSYYIGDMAYYLCIEDAEYCYLSAEELMLRSIASVSEELGIDMNKLHEDQKGRSIV